MSRSADRPASRLNSLRRLFACCLLLVSAALPLHAWAVDTDGDGVDDSIDAFPTYPEATTDTDGDGKPDSIDYSKLPGYFSDDFTGSAKAGWVGLQTHACSSTSDYGWLFNAASNSVKLCVNLGTSHGMNLSLPVQVGAQGGTVSFYHAPSSRFTLYPSIAMFTVDGAGLFSGSSFYGFAAGVSTFPLTAGAHTLSWNVQCGGGGGPTGGLTVVDCGTLDNVVVQSNSSLTEDADDDNDGLPDVVDPAPLNPNSVWPLNSNYKGSAIRESQSVP